MLCREFDISRKTGYKLFSRFKDCGLQGLTDRSRRPYRQANRLPFQVEKLILQLKQEHHSWGAPKIRERIRRKYSDIPLPAISTVHAVLDRHGLVTRGRKARYKATGTTLSRPTTPNDLWCADYKGEFMLSNRPLLLSTDRHGLRQPIPHRLRGSLQHQSGVRLQRLRAHFQGFRTPQGHSHRQRNALRQLSLPLWPHQALGVVVTVGYRARVHHARPIHSRTAVTSGCIGR